MPCSLLPAPSSKSSALNTSLIPPNYIFWICHDLHIFHGCRSIPTNGNDCERFGPKLSLFRELATSFHHPWHLGCLRCLQIHQGFYFTGGNSAKFARTFLKVNLNSEMVYRKRKYVIGALFGAS